VPRKLVPFTVTVVPTGPVLGEKLVIVGDGITVKVPELTVVPPDVVTEIVPEVAPGGTTATI